MKEFEAQKMREEIEAKRPLFRGAIDRCKQGISELERSELEAALLCYMMESVSPMCVHFLTDDENELAGLAIRKIRARNNQLFKQAMDKSHDDNV